MSNNPILPIVPSGVAAVNEGNESDEDELPANDPGLDDGESNDSQAEVERDLAEGKSVNQKIKK